MRSAREQIVYGDSDKEFWRSSGDMSMYRGGVDLVVQTNLHGFEYEDSCFQALERIVTGRLIAIGPHLNDAIFGINTPDYWRLKVRPDGMIFSHHGNKWELQTLVEMKSGPKMHRTHKLLGFSELLAQMRKHGDFYPGRLREYAGSGFQAPDKIFIPPDRSMGVLFIAPFETGVQQLDIKTDFRVTYLRV